MSDDIWESVWDTDFGYDWDSIFYIVNPENEKLIESIIDEWISKSGDEVDEDMSLEEKIEGYDENYDIRNAITGAANDVGINEYIDYLRDTLKSALEEYGSVFEFTNETIKIQIDLKDYTRRMDEDTLDEYYENCYDNPSCVFNELLSEGNIDIPKPRFRDYFDPDINKNDYNENLMGRLNEI